MKKVLRTLAGSAAAAVMLSGCMEKAVIDGGKDDKAEFSQVKVDSLFNQLITTMETAESSDDPMSSVMETDFTSLASELNRYTESGDMKANLGYVMAEMMSLNKNSAMKKLADSLDVYFSSFEDEEIIYDDAAVSSRGEKTVRRDGKVRGIASHLFKNGRNSGSLAKTYRSNGVNGLTMGLMARSPEIILRSTETPSFPRFATISYVQNAIENDLSPKLANVLAALERVETKSAGQSIEIEVDSEKVEIDLADVLLLDASVHALRSSLKLFTAYNFDLYDPTAKDNSWIDSLVRYEEESTYGTIWSMKGDTLIQTSKNSDQKLLGYMYDLMTYNMKRSDFCGIVRQNHAQSYEDLKAVPVKLRAALEALEAEKDNQEDDIVKQVDLSNLEADMVDISADMQAEGLSFGFAQNFKSPKSLIDFTEKVLTQPYTFSEVITGANGEKAVFDITVDISKFYTSPIQDLKSILPTYAFRSKEKALVEESSFSVNDYSDYPVSSFYLGSSDVNSIPASMIDRIENGTWVYLKTPYNYQMYENSYVNYLPFDFTDDKGAVIPWDEITSGKTVPYLRDYTINGIFPGMTRAKWLTQIENLDKL